MVRTQQRQTYGEEVANVLTHGAGMIFGIVAIVLLLIASIRNGNPWAVGSSVVYALSMTLSYVTSTFYHASSHARQKRLLRRFDHSAIYLHIAGTYTPFTLVALRQEGYWGWLLFAIVWIAAVIGVFLSFRKMKKTDHLKTTCYLAMGWVVIIAFKPLVDVFQRTDSMDVLYWLIGGGLFYTVGCVFYFFDTYKYMHPMWHFFVLGGYRLPTFAIDKRNKVLILKNKQQWMQLQSQQQWFSLYSILTSGADNLFITPSSTTGRKYVQKLFSRKTMTAISKRDFVTDMTTTRKSAWRPKKSRLGIRCPTNGKTHIAWNTSTI